MCGHGASARRPRAGEPTWPVGLSRRAAGRRLGATMFRSGAPIGQPDMRGAPRV